MNQVLTLVVRLQPTPEQYAKLKDTATEFASCCEFINSSVKSTLTNRNSIQAVIYSDAKNKFNLVSNHVIRACARVGANRLSAKHKGKSRQSISGGSFPQKTPAVKGFKPTSFDCDKDTFTFREKDWTVSLSTIRGRARISLNVSNYHRGKLAGQKPTSAQVCLHRDGCFYVHIQLNSEAPRQNQTTNVIGVDFGRREIAKTTTDKGWDGKQVNQIRDKYSRVRASLQRKASQGTRSTRRRARRLLQRLSGRERRYQTWLNHNISKSIITEAKETNSTVAIEDLTGIRERTNEQPRNKTERRRSNSWAFHQLRIFLEYKGIKEGVKVIAISPAYTSQTCNCCLHIGIRTNKNFKCVNQSCGWIGDADTNGSLVIALLGATIVNSPKGSWLSCPLDKTAGGLLKAPRSA
ncbi:IS200/IS605 family element transposase accessory protein TnpB [Chroococcidiopsis sp. FACHB-1243]|uniref:RNA-guided endonuclease InsQ/TnpB family protein n=1 Tax=Chroococcidiopsis sp. [FACHB-1243] TaxID=2692781 RepID=UPI001786E394|nr:RNA-guided endonuclease TnpB family protein [Chroococcidiopsis sp. [FACHB-1243]]MBD2309240.1 IS200/IS605 family element transposase accessory protein TnpB [Chroococcidiopsis sp. [FACHB-1243]]